MAEDTLLDTFVAIEVRGQAAAMAAINTFTAQAKRAFGQTAIEQGTAAKIGSDAIAAESERATSVTVKEAATAIAAADSIAAAQAAAAKKGADAAIEQTNRMSAEMQSSFSSLLDAIKKSDVSSFQNLPQIPFPHVPDSPANQVSPEQFKAMLGVISDQQSKADADRIASQQRATAIWNELIEDQTIHAVTGAKRAASGTINEHNRTTASALSSAAKQAKALDMLYAKQVSNSKKAGGQSIQMAVQLGQAFEDAAVGFSLAGAQGALRGAANNINFLIAGLGQAGTLAAVFGTTLATALPIIFAIGTALAFVLPSLIKWFTATEEIKKETLDLGEVIRREFKDAEMFGNIIHNAHDAIKAINDSEDAVKTFLEQVEKTNTGTTKLIESMKRAKDTRAATAVNTRLESLIDVTHESDNKQESTAEQRAATQKARDAVRAMQAAAADIQKAQDQGILNPAAMIRERDAMRALQDSFASMTYTGALTEEQLKVMDGALKELEQSTSKATEEALLLQNANVNELQHGLVAANRAAQEMSKELLMMKAINEGRATEEDRLLLAMREEEDILKKEVEALKKLNSPIANDTASLREKELQMKHEQELLKETMALEKEIAEDRKKNAKFEDDVADKRLKQQEKIAEFAKTSDEKIAKSKQALEDAQQAKETKAAEDALQAQLDAAQKINEVKSKKSTLGDTGQTVFGDDNKKETVERLQKELKNLQSTSAREQADQKIKELEAAVQTAEADKLKGLMEINREARKIEDDAIESRRVATEAMDKLTKQLATFQEQAKVNAAGGKTVIPGVTDLNAPRPEDARGFVPADLPDADVLGALQRAQAERIKMEAEAEGMRREAESIRNSNVLKNDVFKGFESITPGLLPGSNTLDPLQAPPGTSGLAPQWMSSLGSAQAEANARAFENNDFKSSSMEKLLITSNILLQQVVTGVSTIDTQPKFS